MLIFHETNSLIETASIYGVDPADLDDLTETALGEGIDAEIARDELAQFGIEVLI
jgi:hypothetical protein